MDRETLAWWTFLRGVSVLNVVLLVASLGIVQPTSGVALAQAVCATVYTLVCAFRSFFPRVDLERTVLVDHPLSSIALGRASATVAEMAFTVQCALFLGGLATSSGVAWIATVGWVLVPLIAAAQCCCWMGVLSLNHLWHAAEEVLWGSMMVLVAVALFAAWPTTGGPVGTLLPVGILAALGGGVVMLVLDVPMYLKRNREEVAAGNGFLGIAEGWADASSVRRPTGEWAVWKHEVAWMTPYFSAGVWLSLLMVWLAA